MNRELKFRAWDDRTKMWLFSYNHPNLGGFSMKGEVMLFGEYQRFLERVPLEDWSKIILMQYTGLKDKNGKEIYEGDICKLFSCNRQIEFQEGSFGYMTELNNENASFIHISNHNFGWVNGESNKIEVIGNIYENPELLNL